VAFAVLACASTGCATRYEHRPANEQHGQVFYLDGAGGGHAFSPWARGVLQGLAAGGFAGEVQTFQWNTGLGPTADEAATVDYKRGEARKLATLIRRHQDEHPGRPITLIGYSAGTAIAVFALEALPRSHQVDNVILMGSALSRRYDLTEALRRVRSRFVVYTSPKDAVLIVFVGITGTADREFCGTCAAGLDGFDRAGAPDDPETTALYRNVEHVPWRPEFAQAGNDGGHAGWVQPQFVQEHVVPILRRSAPPGPVADQ
jgi:pimeloyl-ACP methyl ester carboxylesterase